jgi:hypothetical protein
MLLVASVAVILSLIAPAAMVWLDAANRLHYHVFTDSSGDLTYSHANPFWPRYWCRLTGKKWVGDVYCRDRNTPRIRRDDEAHLTGDDLGAIRGHLNQLRSAGR